MDTPVIAGIETVRAGLNYLVPTNWWKEFIAINQQLAQPQSLKVPPLRLSDFVDNFLTTYQSQLVQALEEKSSYLNFHSVRINPEINSMIDWTPVSVELWRAINKKLKEKNGILTFIDHQKTVDVKKTLQLQLIFCSKTRSELFVGHMPKNANLVAVIREVGYEMGFVEVPRSKITFVQRSPQVCYTFHQLQKYSVDNAPDIFLMMFNLERKEDDEEKYSLKEKGSFGPFQSKNNSLNESNEAVVGDLNTMTDNSHRQTFNEPLHNRTMSTGAETPFSFALSEGFDLDRQYRVNELFGAKEPQQIEEMRQTAISKINNQEQLITLPLLSEQKHKTFLERLAEQVLEGAAKRKIYKQKEVEKNYQ